MNLQIVHEASTQRQHVRVRIPVRARIAGREYEALNCSVAGIGVENLEPTPQVGHRVPMTLMLRFDGFSFEIEVEGEVRHASSKEVGLVFTDVDPDKHSLLQYVVGAYLSGEIVKSGDIMAVLKRDNFTGARAIKHASAPGLAKRNIAALAVLWTAAAGLMVLVGANVYSRVAIVRAEGSLSSDQIQPVRAPHTGVATVLVKPGQSVRPMDVLATIHPAQGPVTFIRSNCNCTVAGPAVESASGLVAAGAPIVKLIPVNAPVTGVFEAPLEKASQLRAGDRVNVSFYNGAKIEAGVVTAIDLPHFATTRDGAVDVRVRFDRPLARNMLGQPATARVRMNPLRRLVG